MAIKKMKEKLKFIDLFAGIGGFYIAIHLAGGKCVFTSEWNKYARITDIENYKKQFGTFLNYPPMYFFYCCLGVFSFCFIFIFNFCLVRW
jgi:site-specific DNA-cytosine methylase